MAEEPISSKTIRADRKIGFDTQANLSGTGVTLIQSIFNLPPMAEVEILGINITWGLTDNPASDETIRFWIMVGDPDNLPPQGSLQRNSDWSGAQHWVVATEGIVQTLSKEQGIDHTPTKYSTRDFELSNIGQTIMSLGNAPTASSIWMLGTLDLKIELLQLTWRDDDSFDDVTGNKGQVDQPSNEDGELLLEEYLVPLY